MNYPKQVLVIDGDDQYRKLLAVVLRGKDYSVLSASDKHFAALILSQNTIDLIIENVGKNTNLISEELTQNGIGQMPKIVAMSGSPNVLDQLQGRVAGIHVKGRESVETLLQMIARILF